MLKKNLSGQIRYGPFFILPSNVGLFCVITYSLFSSHLNWKTSALSSLSICTSPISDGLPSNKLSLIKDDSICLLEAASIEYDSCNANFSNFNYTSNIPLFHFISLKKSNPSNLIFMQSIPISE